MKENPQLEIPIPLYNDVLADLLDKIRKVKHYAHLEDRFKLRPFVNLSGVGLQVVYKVRNSFAHGSLRFSEPEEWNIFKPIDDEIVNLATRIVLLSIQMILLTYFDDENIEITSWNFWEIKKETYLCDFLRILHLKTEPISENQYSLF